jgi:hypothetical protein
VYQTVVGHGLVHAAGTALHTVTLSVSRLTNYSFPLEVPDVEQLIDLYVRGWIGASSLDHYARMQGAHINVSGTEPAPASSTVAGAKFDQLWERVIAAKQERPTLQETLTLLNRGVFPDVATPQLLQRLGFADPKLNSAVSNLRWDIPSSSDLVRFSVRHVFEPDLIARLGYNEEFRPILDMWHKFQGLNYPIFTGPFVRQVAAFEASRGLEPGTFIRSYAAQGIEDPTWAQAFWWSHWVLPSATQGYEMLFRLRPDRNRAFDPPFARDLNFGLEDLSLLLRANDYPPFYRAPLAAIAHRIPGIRFLRQLRSTGVFGRADVVDLLRRQGYSEGDAEVLAESVERNNRDAQRRAIEQQAKGQIAKYWELGIISSEQYVQLLIDHGLSPEDAQSAARLGEIDLKAKRVQQIVLYLRRQFLSGVVDAEGTRRSLVDVGVTPERAAFYVADWQMEVKARHREISAGRAMKWACQGLISLDELRIRLANLDYDQPDIAGLLAEATACQQGLAGKAANALEKRQRQQIAALKSAQREAARAIQAARRQLSSHGTPSQLRKWYCDGHLGEADLYSRLRFLGWPDDDIQRLVSDCKAGSPAQSGVPSKPKGAGGTVQPGTGG